MEMKLILEKCVVWQNIRKDLHGLMDFKATLEQLISHETSSFEFWLVFTNQRIIFRDFQLILLNVF